MSSSEYYLDAMNVERWRLRENDASESDKKSTLSHYIYALSRAGKLVAYLVTEATLKTPEELGLIEKIVQATKMDYKGGLLTEMPEIGVTSKVVHLAHSPAAMLKDPGLKREVWNKLKLSLAL